MLTLFSKYSKGVNKIKAAKPKYHAAIIYIDKKKGPSHMRWPPID